MKRFIITICILATILCTCGSIAYAQNVGDALGTLNVLAERTGVPDTTVDTGAAFIIKRSLQVVGLVFFVLMFYAGFRWLTARGEEGEIEKARNTIIAAVIGLVIIVAAYGVTDLILSRLIQGTNQGTPPVGSTGGEVLGCCCDKINESVWANRLDSMARCKKLGEDGLDSSLEWEWSQTYVTDKECNTYCQNL
ncbi:MAG: hypothetical protein HOG08_02315 [Candidatus Magasanikbacteria bacterium]|nr:hypothetical protein [Candidatus Magasanikbacteria bacterium]